MIESISKLQEKKGKDIWLVDGGKLITTLLSQNMVDEIIITVIPVILGDGVPLFPSHPTESKWELQNCISYKNGVVQITYKK